MSTNTTNPNFEQSKVKPKAPKVEELINECKDKLRTCKKTMLL